MVICVTGSDIPLGQAIIKRLQASGCTVHGIPYEYFSLTTDALVRQFKKAGPAKYIVNAAELHDLAKAEQYPDLAYQLNVAACEAMAEVAEEWKATVIQLSSFQVFDGQKKNPYISANKGRPISVYGRTKLQGEELLLERLEKILIIRLGWMLDTADEGWMAQALKHWLHGQTVESYRDVEVAPTAVDDVARVVDAVIKQLNCNISVWGIYHYAGAEALSHDELTRALYYQAYGQEASDQQVRAIAQATSAHSVKLPRNGVLGCIKLRNTFGIKQLPWRRYLPAMVEELSARGLVKPVAASEKEAEPAVNR